MRLIFPWVIDRLLINQTRQKIYMVIGALIGAFVGSSIGIAGFGGAIAGTIPIAILCGYIGYRVGKPKEDTSGG